MLTVGPMESQDKDVTRRIGWKNLKAGQTIVPVVKCQGLKPGEKVTPLACGKIIAVDVRRERLDRMVTEPEYGAAEAKREGFPYLDGRGFVDMFCEHMKCRPSQWITRLQFRYETPIR